MINWFVLMQKTEILKTDLNKSKNSSNRFVLFFEPSTNQFKEINIET